MRVQRIESAEDMLALAPEWDRLVERSGYALPFSTFSWSASWWRHLARNRQSVRDRLSLRAVWREGGELAAVAPFRRTERPAFGPVRTRALQFLGADPNITEVPGIVCLPELEREVYGALLADLHVSADEWHWILWSGMKRGGIAAEIIGRVRPLLVVREIPDYVLTLPPSWQAFCGGLSRNIKESLRKCYNSLKRDGHTFLFVVTEQAEEMPAVLSHFFRLHRARAHVSGTVQHEDVFASDSARQFLVDICQALARRGTVRVFSLRIGGQIVATRIGFLLGDALYLYYSGYDPTWSRYSVMTTVVAETMKYAMAAGVRTVNLSTGNDVSKTRWNPAEVSYCEAIQISPSLGAHAAEAVYRSARTAYRGVMEARSAVRRRGNRLALEGWIPGFRV
jgi:CelD/BcsL family acetyltransferase involved in cellulose biosynthesis